MNRRAYWLDIFAILALGLGIGLFLRGYRSFYPIDLWDESSYLSISMKGYWIPQWGALYSLFYALLGKLFRDPIDLYYGNLALQTCALSLLYYVLSRRLGVSVLYSWIGAFAVLISTANAPVIVKINHFNLVCFYLLLLIGSFLRKQTHAVALLCFSSMILIYLRPDNLFLSLGFLAYLIWLTLREAIPLGKRLILCGSYSLALAGLYFGLVRTLQSPFQAQRLWNAFADYYYWSLGGQLHGKTVTQVELMQATFGSTRSVLGALLHNPSTLIPYLAKNASRFLFSELPSSLGSHFPFVHTSVERFFVTSYWESAALGTALLAVSGAWIIRNQKWRNIKSSVRNHTSPLLKLLGVFFLISLLKALVFDSLLDAFVRYYFEFLLSGLLLAFCCLDWTSGKKSAKWTVPIIGILVLICPNHLRPEYFVPLKNYNVPSDPVGKVAAFFRRTPDMRNKKVFALGCYQDYLPVEDWPHLFDPMNYATGHRNPPDLTEMLKKRDFDFIVVTSDVFDNFDRLGKSTDSADFRRYLATAPYFKALVTDYVTVYEKRKD